MLVLTILLSISAHQWFADKDMKQFVLLEKHNARPTKQHISLANPWNGVPELLALRQSSSDHNHQHPAHAVILILTAKWQTQSSCNKTDCQPADCTKCISSRCICKKWDKCAAAASWLLVSATGTAVGCRCQHWREAMPWIEWSDLSWLLPRAESSAHWPARLYYDGI